MFSLVKRHPVMVILPVLAIMLLTIVAFIPTAVAHAQQAKLGPISVQSVYTTDQNQNSKSVFAPGDMIDYHIDVDNNTGSQIPVDVQFEAFAINYNPILYPDLYSYNQTYHVAQMPVGLTRFYNPTTIPISAAPATYDIRITVTESDNTYNTDWGENTFTIPVSMYVSHHLSNFQPLVTQEQFDKLVDLASRVYDINTCLTDLAAWPVTGALPPSTADDCAPVGQDIIDLVQEFQPQPVS